MTKERGKERGEIQESKLNKQKEKRNANEYSAKKRNGARDYQKKSKNFPIG